MSGPSRSTTVSPALQTQILSTGLGYSSSGLGLTDYSLGPRTYSTAVSNSRSNSISTASLINSFSGPRNVDYADFGPMPQKFDPLGPLKIPVASHSIPLIVADPREVERTRNRIDDPIIAGANYFLSSPRVQGAGRIAQAVGEYTLAAGLTGTGLGTVGALLVGAHATDTLNAGFQELVHGRPTETFGAQAIRNFANSSGLQPEAEGLAFAYDILPTVLAPFAGPRGTVYSGQGGTGIVDDVVEGSSVPRPGSVSGNPSNRLIEVPTKNGQVVNRYVRITAEDAQRYRDALADRSVELLNQTPSGLSEEAARTFRHQQMNDFRRQWLDNLYKTRQY